MQKFKFKQSKGYSELAVCYHEMAGFSFIELLISVSVIVLLAVIAYPAYQNYLRRMDYRQIVNVGSAYQKRVNECFELTHKLEACEAGKNKIPAAITQPKQNVASATVKNGIITITPVDTRRYKSTDNYVLTPKIVGNSLVWEASGGGVINGYASKDVPDQSSTASAADD